MSKKEKTDWLDSSNFVECDFDWSTYEGPVYDTPDWVRHPERYPERMKRLKELGVKWTEGLRK